MKNEANELTESKYIIQFNQCVKNGEYVCMRSIYIPMNTGHKKLRKSGMINIQTFNVPNCMENLKEIFPEMYSLGLFKVDMGNITFVVKKMTALYDK